MTPRGGLIVAVIFGLVLAALVSRDGSVALLALPFLFYLGMAVWRAPQSVRLRASRALSATSTDPGSPVEVTLTITNDGASLTNLLVRDDPLAGAERIDGQLSRRLALPGAGETAELRYTISARRGCYAWQSVHVEASDPFGLLSLPLELPAGAELRVRPQVTRLQIFPLRVQETVHAPGPLPAKLAGPGVDFWGAREYHPGDSLRWLMWRRMAREPGRLFTKEFEKHEVADVGLILDARQTVDLPGEPDSLFEHSVRAAAALADVFLRAGDRVSLLVFGDRLVRVFPGYGKVQFNRILAALAGAETGSSITIETLKYLPVRLFPSGSQIIFISPLASSDNGSILRLRAMGYSLLVVSPNPVEFAAQGARQDTSSQLAYQAARLERSILLGEYHRAGVTVVDWTVDQPLNAALRGAIRSGRGTRQVEEAVR